jgi:hypothetical protein
MPAVVESQVAGTELERVLRKFRSFTRVTTISILILRSVK